MNIHQKLPRPTAAKALKGQTGGAAKQDPVCVYRKATYQDILDAPPNMVAEIVDGRLHTQPRPIMPHAFTGSALAVMVGGPFSKGRGGPGGWWVVYEPELHFGTFPNQDIVVPDWAGWRRERMPEYPDTAYCTLAPDWVCEILSPSNRDLDTGRKSDIYAREGIPYFWLIDPRLRTLQALELQNGQWQTIATLTGDAQVAVPPFAAAPFPLNELWP